jgi:hypothetical protein
MWMEAPHPIGDRTCSAFAAWSQAPFSAQRKLPLPPIDKAILTIFARLGLFAIKNPRLQHIFNEEIADLQKAFLDLEKTES